MDDFPELEGGVSGNAHDADVELMAQFGLGENAWLTATSSQDTAVSRDGWEQIQMNEIDSHLQQVYDLFSDKVFADGDL